MKKKNKDNKMKTRGLDQAIQHKKLFLLDIDGTIAFDDILFDGASEFFQYVNEIQGKYIFITNNSTKSIKDYIEKFQKWQIPIDESNFLTASYATALYLKEHYRKKLIYVVGTKSFQKELLQYNLNITTNLDKKENIEVAVVGFDNELNYKKIEQICELLQTKEIIYIATNPDLVCPVGYGFIPDCGAICDFIGKAVNRKPLFIGKPNASIVEMALNRTKFSKEETLVIGDRLYTDIACGINGGVDTLVVFSGEAKKEDLISPIYMPTYYCNNIKEFYLFLKILRTF